MRRLADRKKASRLELVRANAAGGNVGMMKLVKDKFQRVSKSKGNREYTYAEWINEKGRTNANISHWHDARSNNAPGCIPTMRGDEPTVTVIGPSITDHVNIVDTREQRLGPASSSGGTSVMTTQPLPGPLPNHGYARDETDDEESEEEEDEDAADPPVDDEDLEPVFAGNMPAASPVPSVASRRRRSKGPSAVPTPSPAAKRAKALAPPAADPDPNVCRQTLGSIDTAGDLTSVLEVQPLFYCIIDSVILECSADPLC